MAYLPLFIDFSGKRVLIFGGGTVGERKARYFSGADVVIVSPDFTPGLEAMEKEGKVSLLHKSVMKKDIKTLIRGAFIVVAATDDQGLNEKIVSAAQKSQILANSATDTAEVVVPSLINKGSVMVAISTGGRSPAMSRYLRLRLEGSIGEDVEKMVALQERLREHLQKTVKDRKRREAILREVLDDAAVWEALGEEKAFETAIRHIDK